MTTTPKTFRTPARADGDCDGGPSLAVYTIDHECAKQILALSALAIDNGLHKVERFDYRAQFFRFDSESDPEDATDAGDENEVRTDCDVLVVQQQAFFFRAYVKHTGVPVASEAQPIDVLVDHFGLQRPQGGPANAACTGLAPQAPAPDDIDAKPTTELVDALRKRGLAVSVWGIGDVSTLVQEDGYDLADDQVQQVAESFLAHVARDLEGALGALGNEYTANRWSQLKSELLPR